MYACRRSVEAAESEIEFEVPLRLHRCCIAVDEESGVDLQCLSVLLKAMDGMKAVKKVLPSYYSDIDMDFVGSLERYDTSVPEPFKNFSL